MAWEEGDFEADGSMTSNWKGKSCELSIKEGEPRTRIKERLDLKGHHLHNLSDKRATARRRRR
jgi:hypothetical protein